MTPDWFWLLDAAIAEFAAAVEDVDSPQLSLSTPCSGWDVGAVIRHVTASNDWVNAVLAGREPKYDTAYSNDDLVAAWQQSADALKAGFARGLDRAIQHPLGPAPSGSLVLFRCTEHVIHAWDVSRAIGRNTVPSTDVTEALLSVVRPIGLLLAATGDYDRPILVAHAQPHVELLGWFGRKE